MMAQRPGARGWIKSTGLHLIAVLGPLFTLPLRPAPNELRRQRFPNELRLSKEPSFMMHMGWSTNCSRTDRHIPASLPQWAPTHAHLATLRSSWQIRHQKDGVAQWGRQLCIKVDAFAGAKNASSHWLFSRFCRAEATGTRPSPWKRQLRGHASFASPLPPLWAISLFSHG